MATRYLLSLFFVPLLLTGCMLSDPPNTSTQIQSGTYEVGYDSVLVRFTFDSPQFSWEYFKSGVLMERQWGTWNYQKTQSVDPFTSVVGHLRLLNDSDEIFSGDSSFISSLGDNSISVTASTPQGFTLYYEVADTSEPNNVDVGIHGHFAYANSHTISYTKK